MPMAVEAARSQPSRGQKKLMLPAAAFSSFSSQLPRPVEQAQQIIEARISDPTFLIALVQMPKIVAVLSKALKAQASRDMSFASLLVSMQPNAEAKEPPTACAASPENSAGAVPSVKGSPKLQEISTPMRQSGSERKRGGAAALSRSGASRRTPGLMECRQSPPAAAGGQVPRRSLFEAFEEESEESEREEVGQALAPKSRRTQRDLSEGLLPLPAVVAAQVIAFLPFRDTVRLAKVVSGAQEVLQLPAAWDPLVLDAEESGFMLRHLRRLDPLAMKEPSCYPWLQAKAWAEVTELRMETMDPDRVRLPEDDEELLSSEVRHRTREAAPNLVMDPLEEFSRRLRKGWLPGLLKMELSNLEGNRLDYFFPQLRKTAFARFHRLRVEREVSLESDGRYVIRASCVGPASLAGPARQESLILNSARRELSGVGNPGLLPVAEEVGELDALFLQEHTSVFKSGDRFHLVHAPWRTFDTSQVYQCYKQLLDLHGVAGCAAD